jgi:two-component system chemotaxis response regulator CheB
MTADRWIAIGASGAGGLSDIKDVLAGLPFPLPAVVLVVLHRPADRISSLAKVLAAATRAPVRIASEGESFHTGTIYIGEPDEHLTMGTADSAQMVEGGRHQYRGRTIDLLFKSVAAKVGKAAIGVVLSGSLDDGSRGLAAIHQAGGVSMVLTPASDATSAGMPENAIEFDGPVDVIGSPALIAREITKLLTT